jgi:hypothetical protein
MLQGMTWSDVSVIDMLGFDILKADLPSINQTPSLQNMSIV